MPSPARGARIDGPLEHRLAGLEAGDSVSVILYMEHQAPISRINEDLKRERASRAERHVRVIGALQQAQGAQADLLAFLEERKEQGEVAGYTSYWIANLVVARVTKELVYELAARDDIEGIEANFTVEPIEPTRERSGINHEGRVPGHGRTPGRGATPGLRAIRADEVWEELGITGAGRLVANLDTGVDATHPALSASWRGNHGHPPGECWLGRAGGSFPVDNGEAKGHGTHVMGTMVGVDGATEDTVGVAWGALWIACDYIDWEPGSPPSQEDYDNGIITALQWFADPDGDPETTDDVPDVLQNSWGMGDPWEGYEYCFAYWWDAIDNCEAAGVVTVWIAGNEGPAPETIRSPADRAATLTNAFSVGSIDATHYNYPWPMADDSSSGPTTCDVPEENLIKPEVTAPGEEVRSSCPESEYVCPESGYMTKSGTSMAGPHVAGIVALMREADPDLDVDTIKEIIMATAVDHGDYGEDNEYGWGVVDAYAAVLISREMSGYGTLAGEVRNSWNFGLYPVPYAMLEVEELGLRRWTDRYGVFSFSLPPGTYSVTASHPSFDPETRYDVVVEEGMTNEMRPFYLDDIAPPEFDTELRWWLVDVDGPYDIYSRITDYSTVASATLYYRYGEAGAFNPVVMYPAPPPRTHVGLIPGPGYPALVQYYLEATDGYQTSTDPPDAPSDTYSFRVDPDFFEMARYAMEGVAGWFHQPIDPAYEDQWHLSDLRNHTPNGMWSWKCGNEGLWGYDPLLDGVLISPEFLLGDLTQLRYWQWIDAEVCLGQYGQAYDGGLVEIRINRREWEQIFPEGGYTHRIAEGAIPGSFPVGTEVFSGHRSWHPVFFDLSEYHGVAQIRFRFGSDGTGSGQGWYVDDMVVVGILGSQLSPELPQAPRFFFGGADPNPFSVGTKVRYEIARTEEVLLQILDPTGRVVRTLAAGRQQPGAYEVDWDGRDAGSNPLPSGWYLARLQAGTYRETGRLILIR